MANNSVKVGEKVNVPAKQEQEAPTFTVKDFINKYQDQFKRALPKVMDAERFTRIALTAVQQNPDLGNCTPASLLGALLTSAQLGLEVNTPLGQAYIIPYYNSRTRRKEAQFQPGYRGLITLAYRSGEFQSIDAQVVRENDEFEYELGLNPKLRHIPATSNRGDIVRVYAVYRLKSGGFGFCVMSTEDINKHRDKYSKAGSSSPWQSNWEAMAKKTCLKQALKYAPISSDLVRDMSNDEVTLNYNEAFEHPDDAVIPDMNSAYADEPEVTDVEPEVVENK